MFDEHPFRYIFLDLVRFPFRSPFQENKRDDRVIKVIELYFQDNKNIVEHPATGQDESLETFSYQFPHLSKSFAENESSSSFLVDKLKTFMTTIQIRFSPASNSRNFQNAISAIGETLQFNGPPSNETKSTCYQHYEPVPCGYQGDGDLYIIHDKLYVGSTVCTSNNSSTLGEMISEPFCYYLLLATTLSMLAIYTFVKRKLTNKAINQYRVNKTNSEESKNLSVAGAQDSKSQSKKPLNNSNPVTLITQSKQESKSKASLSEFDIIKNEKPKEQIKLEQAIFEKERLEKLKQLQAKKPEVNKNVTGEEVNTLNQTLSTLNSTQQEKVMEDREKYNEIKQRLLRLESMNTTLIEEIQSQQRNDAALRIASQEVNREEEIRCLAERELIEAEEKKKEEMRLLVKAMEALTKTRDDTVRDESTIRTARTKVINAINKKVFRYTLDYQQQAYRLKKAELTRLGDERAELKRVAEFKKTMAIERIHRRKATREDEEVHYIYQRNKMELIERNQAEEEAKYLDQVRENIQNAELKNLEVYNQLVQELHIEKANRLTELQYFA